MTAERCGHCDTLEAVAVLTWGYPDETYELEAALCDGCAGQVRRRDRAGHVILTEDEPLLA